MLGQALLMTGKSDAAKAAFDAAIAASPGYAPAIVGLARMRGMQRDLAGALALVDAGRSTRIASFSKPGSSRATCSRMLGELTEAIDAYQNRSTSTPITCRRYFALIARSLEDGKLDEAGKQLAALRRSRGKHPQTSTCRR